MTVKQMSETLGYPIVCDGGAAGREIQGIYCCDLLSIVMGRAPAGSAWITVMGNINAVAVAVLCDTACIIVAENVEADAGMLEKAAQQDVCVIKSPDPIYETAMKITELLRS